MYILSDILSPFESIRHAFFTRESGISDGIYASLNGGPGSSDKPENIRENRRRMAEYLEVRPENFLGLYQIHSSRVIEVRHIWRESERPQADALVTREPGIALTIATADCGPLLFFDPAAHVIGAAHAGWKGALGGVIETTLDAMEKIGANRKNIHAVLGPTISAKSYEVGPVFPEPFIRQDSKNQRFFKESPQPDHFLFDLPGYILSRLEQAGLSHPDKAASINCCTYQDETRFFSYRRATHRQEADYGRIISAICLTG